jgi:hypothetical protein
MSDRIFNRPILVKDGNVLIREISCLEDALEFLYEWPKNRRGPIYETALRACQRAFDSDYPLTAARDALASFTKSAGIMDDVTAPLPWMTGSKSNQDGGVTA